MIGEIPNFCGKDAEKKNMPKWKAIEKEFYKLRKVFIS